jgi:hypothetical protein
MSTIPTLPVPALAPQLAAPISYPYACTDLIARPLPASFAVPPDANSTFVDAAFGRIVHRVTNGASGNTSNRSFRVPSSENACAWRRDVKGFVCLTTGGTVKYFAFDPTTAEATYVRDLPFATEPTCSRLRPSVIYGTTNGGSVGWKVLAFDVDSGVQTTLLDLAQIDPAYAVSGLYFGGSTQSSAANPERLAIFYGGSGQDKHFRVCVFDPTDLSTRLVLDTQAKTINGIAAPLDVACHVHSVGLDQSGRYVLLYPTGGDITAGAAQSYVWDVTTGTIVGLRKDGAGHACDGYGVHINKDGGIRSPYDADSWVSRALVSVDAPSAVPTALLSPALVYASDHPQYNNARADAVTPFATITYRFNEDVPNNLSTDPNQRINTVPWRAWDNEVLTVHPVTGVVSRWGQHGSDIYADDGSSVSAAFEYQPMPQISPDGRWLLFSSNRGKTLGLDAGSKSAAIAHRTDLFLVDLMAMPAVTILDPTPLVAQIDAMQRSLSGLQTSLATVRAALVPAGSES